MQKFKSFLKRPWIWVVAGLALFVGRFVETIWCTQFGDFSRVCYIDKVGQPLTPAWKYSSFDAALAPRIKVDGTTYETPSGHEQALEDHINSFRKCVLDGRPVQMWRLSSEELNNGKILLCGVSLHDGKTSMNTDRTWLVNRATHTIEDGPRMKHKCCAPILTVLRDHRILVTGGLETDMTGPLNYIEIYDPQANVFSDLGVMAMPRAEQSCIQLDDDHILIVGGETGSDKSKIGSLTGSTEVLNLRTGKSSLAGSISPRRRPILINDGANKILVIGGWYSTAVMGDTRWVYGCETFVPKPEAFR